MRRRSSSWRRNSRKRRLEGKPCFTVLRDCLQVNIDIVNFGEDDSNADILNKFITTINGKEGTGSHLVTIPPGPHLSDALVSSPILQGEDGMAAAAAGGGGFEFGVNPDDDPELALALRVSMEEQRARQQAEAGGGQESGGAVVGGTEDESSEEAMLQRALAMSMDTGEAPAGSAPAPARDLSTMTEEEQIAYAMQVSHGSLLLTRINHLFRCPWLMLRKLTRNLNRWMWTRKMKTTPRS